MSDREAVLAAVRAALGAAPAPSPAQSAYRRKGEMDAAAAQARFLERLADYDVHVEVLDDVQAIAPTVARRMAERETVTLAIPADLPRAWIPENARVLADDALPYPALDTRPSVLTGCALAIAETGTVVLDAGAAQGRRALTLLPDHHLCVVFARQVVETVPEALQNLKAAVDAGRPLTFFSGPSATADIEFDRVVGVHGPRALDILLVRD
ncbi:MAG: LUD domain-containing protein [Caulobacteraceae bacterium]|nr:LUD domain-containing protein [Caulobacteraceae bacterium]